MYGVPTELVPAGHFVRTGIFFLVGVVVGFIYPRWWWIYGPLILAVPIGVTLLSWGVEITFYVLGLPLGCSLLGALAGRFVRPMRQKRS